MPKRKRKKHRRNRKFVNLTGKTFGMIEVLRLDKVVRTKYGSNRRYYMCKCSCGKEKSIATFNLTSGQTKSCGCFVNSLRKGDKHPCWKGGRRVDKGYVYLWNKDHPNNIRNYVREHVFVMSNHIGRPLLKGETVHHKNGIKHDNRIENLELWSQAHPGGQRVEDMIDFCVKYLNKYKHSYISNKAKRDVLKSDELLFLTQV